MSAHPILTGILAAASGETVAKAQQQAEQELFSIGERHEDDIEADRENARLNRELAQQINEMLRPL